MEGLLEVDWYSSKDSLEGFPDDRVEGFLDVGEA